ncbi:MAG: ABC1 kinase family protein [Actinomycetota bacterium]
MRRHVRQARPGPVDPRRAAPGGRGGRAEPAPGPGRPAPPESVRSLLKAELGRPVGEVSAEFDPEPIAAASIAQAYRGRLRSGEAVVVKVQRLGIAESVDRDLLVLAELARVAETRTAWGAGYHVTDLADEFAERVREELDFRLEARNATEIAAAMDAGDQVHVPVDHSELSMARVLVMEWLDGVSVREVERIDALGLDRSRLAEALLRCALRQMLVDGRFHADPHPGNVLVLEDGRLGLIDFGATGRLDPLQQASMREMLVAVQQRDAGLLRSAVLEVATLRRHFDDDQLERALACFVARHLAAGAAPARPCSTTCCSCSSPSGSTSRRSSRPSSGPWSPWKGP